MTYAQAVQYLYDSVPVFHRIGGDAYKPGLNNTRRLLDALGNPQDNYKSIHIAGTNGKGSVSHMLAAVLQQAGYKVGLYTSPHLVHFGERIRLDGEMIEPAFVVDFVTRHQRLIEEVQPSFFETTMAMAFDYFACKQADVAIVETGLGGRLDSTNIIRPEMSVITNISFDHTAFLGNTLEAIAAEKAGIIKGGTPVVIGESLPETRHVFTDTAHRMAAPLTFAEETVHIAAHRLKDGCLSIQTDEGKTYRVGLTGTYQLKNVTTVLAALRVMKGNHFFGKVTDDSICQGLAKVAELTGLQGRWQTVAHNPHIVLDTAHNPAGIKNVARQLQQQTCKTLRIVIGMAADKDVTRMLALLPTKAVYYFTQANTPRALEADKLLGTAASLHLLGTAYHTVAQAVKAATSDAAPDDFILIGGSNFVVGEALECLPCATPSPSA